MKTINLPNYSMGVCLRGARLPPWLLLSSLLLLSPLLLQAQSTEAAGADGSSALAELAEAVDRRPEQSDAASLRLIGNYLAVTGGQLAHRAQRNVVAEGLIKESTLLRNFKLIETNDGKRHLTYEWTHLGREHRVIYVHDGLQTWTQVLAPKKQDAKVYGGSDGAHFASQRWLLQPFTLPSLADYTFKYQGGAKVSGRPAYVVKAYGKGELKSWFYFDKEEFLLTRWGGEGQIAGVKEDMDYRATQFKPVGGVLLPSQIDLLAENSAFGQIRFKRIEVNQNVDSVSFFMPQSMTPTLRQRPIAPN